MLYRAQKDKARRVVPREHKENNGVLEQIKKSNPKYLEHILQKNDIIMTFAKSTLGGLDLLEQPMCNHCEKPGAWNTGGTCYCWACGTVTKDPITFYEYLAQELKLSEEDVKMILSLAYPNSNPVNIIDGGLK